MRHNAVELKQLIYNRFSREALEIRTQIGPYNRDQHRRSLVCLAAQCLEMHKDLVRATVDYPEDPDWALLDMLSRENHMKWSLIRRLGGSSIWESVPGTFDIVEAFEQCQNRNDADHHYYYIVVNELIGAIMIESQEELLNEV